MGDLESLISKIETKFERKNVERKQFVLFCPLENYDASELTSFRCLLAASSFIKTLEKYGKCSILGLPKRFSKTFAHLKLSSDSVDEEFNEYFDMLEHLNEQHFCSCGASLCLGSSKIGFKNNIRHITLRSSNLTKSFTPEAVFSCHLVKFCIEQKVTKIYTIFPVNHQNFINSCQIICRLLNADIQFITFPVGIVTIPETNLFSIDDYIIQRRKKLINLYKRKHPSPNEISEEVLEPLLWTFITFEFLTKSVNKNLVLTDFSCDLDTNSSSEGVKVMYNYARICSIIRKFEKLVERGRYPPLKSLLELNEENKSKILLSMGSLLEIFLFNEIDEDFNKLPNYCNTMIKFTTSFSKFYRRNQILTEPSPILVENLLVKMNILYFMQRCMINIFTLLSIIPIEEM